MEDKGYIRPDNSVPGLRKITPFKGKKNREQKNFNRKLKPVRIRIEMFFGRLKQAWGIFKKPYSLSLEFFDLDFDNCMFLTNELLKKRALSDFDREYYKKIIQLRKNVFLEKKRKRKESF